MKQILHILLIGLATLSSLQSQNKYYSRQNGTWSNPSTWSLNASGTPAAITFPSATDTVVIRNLVIHNCGIGYIFYGNLRVTAEGVYQINSGTGLSDPYYFAGNLFEVYGILISSSDFHNQLPYTTGPTGTGTMYVGPLAYIQFGDDFILNSLSNTILDNPACGSGTAADDVYFKGANARLCGGGRLFVPDQLRAWNNSDVEQIPATTQLANQVCAGFSVYSDPDDCANGVNPIFTGSGPFPVEWLALSAESYEAGVTVSWITANETNNWYFTVERAENGLEFQPLGDISGAGTTTLLQTYSFTDFHAVQGHSYYRIRQTDFDGNQAYSSLLEVFRNAEGASLIGFTDAEGRNRVHLSGFASNELSHLAVFDLQGRKITLSELTISTSGEADYTLPEGIAAGFYLVRVVDSKGISAVCRISAQGY